MHASYAIPAGRKAKRIKNRLRKNGLDFLRIEQNDSNLVTMRVILQTRSQKLGRAFVYPHVWLLKTSPRGIADSILSDYARGYGHLPH